MTNLAKIFPESRQLDARLVEKPWGRTALPAEFAKSPGQRIGEVWFEDPTHSDLPLLAKLIFTSERLSIQVHPDGANAREPGKNECWYIVAADGDATVGLGLTKPLLRDEIAAAAADGSIANLLHWQSVTAGDFIYVPAGTIHAIGAGISLIEFQQNADTTYRLYDYGRARELHVEQATAVAQPTYDFNRHFRPASDPMNCVLADTDAFSLVRATSREAIPEQFNSRRRWVMPIEGTASADGISVSPGGCLLAEAGAALSMSESAVVLVGVEGRI